MDARAHYLEAISMCNFWLDYYTRDLTSVIARERVVFWARQARNRRDRL